MCGEAGHKDGASTVVGRVPLDGGMVEMHEVPVDVAVVDEDAFGALRALFGGELLRHADDGYDVARRVWNGNIDRRPAIIARCRGVADIQRALAFAVEHGLVVSVRGGGHSAPGYGTNDGGMVIDLAADGLIEAAGATGTRSCCPLCSLLTAPRSATQILPAHWTPTAGGC